jgi:hypothetical protein
MHTTMANFPVRVKFVDGLSQYSRHLYGSPPRASSAGAGFHARNGYDTRFRTTSSTFT